MSHSTCEASRGGNSSSTRQKLAAVRLHHGSIVASDSIVGSLVVVVGSSVVHVSYYSTRKLNAVTQSTVFM